MRFAPATTDAAPQVCIIAEIGVNHDGVAERAVELVQAAADAGADAVKFQLFDAEALLSNQALLAEYQKSGPGISDAEPETGDAQPDAAAVLSMLSRLQLSPADLRAVRAAARDAGLAFVLTPFSLEVIDTLASLDVDAVKIASPDAVNHPLLRAAAGINRTMIISTGTAEPGELAFAAELLRSHAPGGCLLQCVSSYPTPIRDAALGGIPALAERFGLPVGYSDHTADVWCGALAVAAGACVLEKHLTHDRAAAGPDHAASLEPDDFARYVRFARRAAAMLGPLAKRCLPIERDVREVSRQSVCVVHDLGAGHVLRRSDLTVKRPGVGVPAAELDRVIGRTLLRKVAANDLLTPADLHDR